MLQKPGSSTPRTTRSKAAVQESPEDVLRKLSRLPGNKKCCDCSSKLPNIVNVTIGAFLCTTCAGIHRELPSTPRIKSIGHTTFTKEEVDFIAEHGGNERVNALYLANYHVSRERLRQPTDNSDVHLLRTWIHRKYKDKAWYAGSNSEATSQRTNAGGGGGATSGRGVAGAMRQPTVVANIPPKAKAVVVDLFDTAPPPQTTAAAAVDEWDAFSTSRTQQHQAVDDFANFGGSSNTASQPSNFANFDSNPPPTVPPPASSAENFAAFPLPNAAPASQAGMNPSNAATVPPPQQQPFPASNQFAAFPSAPPAANDAFANFDSLASTPNPVGPSSEPAPPGMNGMMAPPQMAPATAAPLDKFDAFNSLQMSNGAEHAAVASPGDNSVAPANVATMNATTSTAVPAKTKVAKYKSGQKVYYKSASYIGPAEVIKVHFDDELEPFYTINVEGKEKQTDDAHLAEDHPMLQEIKSMLAPLSVEQLQRVKQFIVSLSTGPTLPTAANAAAAVMSNAPVAAPSNIPPPSMPTAPPMPSAPQPVQNMPNPPTSAQSFSMTHGYPAPQQQPQMAPATNMPPQQQPQQQQALTQNMQTLSMQNMPQGVQTTPQQNMPPPTGMSMPPQPMPSNSMMMNANNAAAGGGFSGIPSPGGMDGANPSVPNNAGLPPPPLVHGAPGGMMMHQPQQGQFPMMTTQMAPQGYMMQQPHYPPHGQQFQNGSNPSAPYPQQGPPSFTPPHQPMPQGHVQPQMQLPQNHQAPQSPLSPKGNPFDFY